MQKLMTTWMLSCKKATELIERKIYFGLPLSQRFKILLHLRMCDACKQYEKQSLLIHRALSRQATAAFTSPAPAELEAFKKKVKTLLER